MNREEIKEIQIGLKNFRNKIFAKNKSQFEIYNKYEIIGNSNNKIQEINFSYKSFNGCEHEDLLKILIDRLKSLQRTIYSCKENERALVKCEEALMWLNNKKRGT